jgi:type IX secretion system PorP/SprF family membrane protein
MKTYLLLMVIGLVALNGNSQQLHSSSFYEMHGLLHNPATAGSSSTPVIGVSYKSQWKGMPGAPTTATVFGNAMLHNSNIGLGGYLFNDVTGPTSKTGIQAAYAYHVKLGNDRHFSIGLEGRLQQFSYNRQKLEASLGANDPVLSGIQKRIKADAGLGILYRSDVFSIGASVNQLIQSKYNLYEPANNEAVTAKEYRHYYLHGNYNIRIDESTKVIPSLLCLYLPNAPLEFIGGAKVEHNNLFWYGLSWKVRQSWMIAAGVKIADRFNIGYSFDIYSTPLSVYDGGSNGNELLLRYEFR